MTQDPDSRQPANVAIEWQPPGERTRVSTGFVNVLASLLEPWRDLDADISLIVPDALGPGPQEEIWTVLRNQFETIRFVPRTIAGALSWCQRALPRYGQGTATGKRIGRLLVTTTAADNWEAAAVPIRLEQHEGQNYLCPVHERTALGSEIGAIGLARLVQNGAPSDRGFDPAPWLTRLLTDPAPHGFHDDRPAAEAAEEALLQVGPPRTATPNCLEQIVGLLRESAAENTLLDWVHVGNTTSGRTPKFFEPIAAAAEIAPTLRSTEDLLDGGREALRRITADQTTYYESLAKVDLFVMGRNNYRDPIGQWRPLIEAKEVPAGQEYRSPSPIDELSLPAGEVQEIDLWVRSHWRGRSSIGRLRATQSRPQETAEPLEITARLSPGQGMARIAITSETPRNFDVTVREGDLTTVPQVPDLTYAWPPGSAWVISSPTLADKAWVAIDDALKSLRREEPMDSVIRSIRAAGRTTNKWLLPEALDVRVSSLDLPDGIHTAFVYLGVFPTGDDTAPPTVEEWATRYGQCLVDAYPRAHKHNAKKSLLYAASWLYTRCPRAILDVVREQLEVPGAITDATLACAGMTFSTTRDYQLFFSALETAVRNNYPPDNMYWLRAYQNLARFRADSLSTEALDAEQQGVVLGWYLDVLEDAMLEHRKKWFLHCAYLAPHILKRRRFDPKFLAPGGRDYERVHACFEQALEFARLEKHKVSLQCALEFLSNTATSATLQKMRQGEELGNLT